MREQTSTSGKLIAAVVYVVIFAASLVGLIHLMAWAFRGGTGETVTYAATLHGVETARTEYLVDQAVDTAGLSLEFTPEDGEMREISAQECTVAADFSSAGNKKVTLSYRYDQYTVYSADYYVEIYKIRHIEVQKYPSSVTENADGSYAVDGLEIWAELDRVPQTGVFTQPTAEDAPEVATWETNTVIKLDETLCSVSVAEHESKKNYFAVSVACNSFSQSFGIYQTNGDSYFLSAEDDVLDFTNKSGTADTLRLVVNEHNNPQSGTGTSSGWYYYTDAAGTTTKYRFSYSISNWASSFHSSEYSDEIAERQYGSGMKVTVNDVVFYALQPDWHGAVVDLATTDVGVTYEEALAQEEAQDPSKWSYQATFVEIIEEEGKIYYVVGGTYEGSKETFVIVAENIYFNLEGNGTASGGSDWTMYTFTRIAIIGDDNTFSFRYDITDLKSYCYTSHFGQIVEGGDRKANLSLGAEYNGVVFTVSDGSVYTLISVPGSEEGSEYWGAVGLKVQKPQALVSVTVNGQTITVDSKDRILVLENKNTGSTATLVLYVTLQQRTDGNGEAGGYYVYTAEDGTQSVYKFKYGLENWASTFSSAAENAEGAISENFINPDYEVTVEGQTFHAGSDAWHLAVLAM